MNASNETIRPIAVVNPPKVNAALILFLRTMHGALLNNPSFPSPTPKLAEFKADIDAFEESEAKAATRARGAAKFRDARKKKVLEDVNHLQDYVQSVAEKAENPDDAAALIQSVFMSVRKVASRETPELSAKNSDISGKVTLAAKRVALEATYFWEYSLDRSTWIPVHETMKARTEITGLTSAHVHYFRFRALTRAGRRDYSQVVSLLVH